MAGDRLDVVERVRVEVDSRLSLISRSLNDVVQVGNDAGRGEGVAAVVEVDAPRIAGPLGEDLERVPRGVIPPDARIDRNPLFVGGARLPTRECVNTPWQPYSQPSGPR